MFFKNKVYTTSIIKLAIPVALQNLISAVLNIFDQIMVGGLPSPEVDSYLSAVLLAGQVVFVYQTILFATANAVNIFVAQYAAKGEIKIIPQRVGVALAVNGVATVIVMVLCIAFPSMVIGLFNPKEIYRQYAEDFLAMVAWSFLPMFISATFGYVLRALKRLTVPLITSVIAVLANIALNYIFMYGKLGVPAYGLMGAAYGTIASRALETVLILICLLWKKYPIFARPKVMFKYDKVFTKQFFKVFLPIVLNEVCWALSNFVYMFVYDKLPNSEVILAAVNITSTVDKVLSVIMMGVGAAACVIMGHTIASNDKQKLKKYASYSIQFGIVSGVLVGILTVISAFVAPAMFTNASQQAQDVAKNMIIIYGITAVFRSLGYMLIVGILRSGGDTTFTMVSELLVVWLISVPLVLLCGLKLGWDIYALNWIIMAVELLKVVICYIRSRGTKWIKLVVDNNGEIVGQQQDTNSSDSQA